MSTVLPHADGSLTVARQEADIGHWPRTLARHVWFLRRAGIASAQIEQEIARSLRQCLTLRTLPVPPAGERMYPRILAHWQHESAYLDIRGQPLALRFDGRSPTFQSLVRAAVPGANALKTLAALKRYRLVSQSRRGVVRLLADGLLPRDVHHRGSLLIATLASLEALTDTCYANLAGRRPLDGSPRIQLAVYTDYLDHRSRRAYEAFLNESAHVYLAMHETWLRRHEVKNVNLRRKQIRRVGIGVFAIRDRLTDDRASAKSL